MRNPWESLDLNIYEKHMNLKNVAQIPLLNNIMKSQFSYIDIDSVAIFGVAGGNGLEHVNNNLNKIYCIDINIEYLDAIKKRYSHLNNLIFENLDLNDSSIDLKEADLVIANLIIEYIGLNSFLTQIKKNSSYLCFMCDSK